TIAQCFGDHRRLLRLTDLRRLEEQFQSSIIPHRIRDILDELAPHGQILRTTRQLQQRLGVIPRYRDVAHQRLSGVTGIDARKLSTIRRLESSSRFFSMTFDAPAIARSTASRPRSDTAR